MMQKFKAILGCFSLFIPPCLLLPLAMIPPDIGTSIYWFAGFVAAAISLFNVVVRSVKLLLAGNIAKLTLVRPVLTVLIFSLCLLSIKISTSHAREQARSEAERILNAYSGAYPDALDGWMQSKYASAYSYRTVGWPAKYNLSYRRDENNHTFLMILRINIDAEYVYTVTDGKITETYHCC